MPNGDEVKVTYREIDLGCLDGKSAYELAKDHGFIGSEEDYVNQQQKYFNDMKDYGESLKKEMGQVGEQAMKRLNDMGDIEDVVRDNIYNYTVNNGTTEEGDAISYSFRNDNSQYFGMEKDSTHGVQLRISWIYGMQFRYKNDTPDWSDWKTVIHVEDEE